MLAYMEGGTWSPLPPQPCGPRRLLFYETNAFSLFLITFTMVHFFG